LSTESLAWAAGLFEGEGTVGCWSAGGGRVRLGARIEMTDEDRLSAFASATGLGQVRRGSARRARHWKPIFVWLVSGHEHVQALAALLWDWLGPRRREQFRSAIVRYRAVTPGKRMDYPSDQARTTAHRLRQWRRHHRVGRVGTGQEAML